MEIKIHAVPYEKEGHKMLRVECDAAILFPTSPGLANMKQTRALWDTGATNTCIPMKTAVAMGIPLGDEIPMRMGSAVGRARFCKFLIQLPTGDIIPISEGAAVPNMQTGLIIGMDVMRHGHTTIEPDGDGGVRFTFSI